MRLNLPLQIQHNLGFGGYIEGKPNATIRRLGAYRNKGRIPTHPRTSMILKRGRCGKSNNRSRIGSDIILELWLGLTQPYETVLQAEDLPLINRS